MSTLASLAVERDGRAAIARIEGELDLSNTGEVRAALEDLLTENPLGLVLDLSSLSYLDSAAVRLLFRLHDALERRQRQLRLVVPSGARFERVLKLTGVFWRIRRDETVGAALSALEAEVHVPLSPEDWLSGPPPSA